MNKLLTIRELATALNCSRTTIWRKVKDGALPAPLKVCGMTRWKPEVVNDILKAAEAQYDKLNTPEIFRGNTLVPSIGIPFTTRIRVRKAERL